MHTQLLIRFLEYQLFAWGMLVIVASCKHTQGYSCKGCHERIERNCRCRVKNWISVSRERWTFLFQSATRTQIHTPCQRCFRLSPSQHLTVSFRSHPPTYTPVIQILTFSSCFRAHVFVHWVNNVFSRRRVRRESWMPEDQIKLILLLIRHFVKLFLIILLAFISTAFLSYLLIDPRVRQEHHHPHADPLIRHDDDEEDEGALPCPGISQSSKRRRIRGGSSNCFHFNYPQISNKVTLQSCKGEGN